MNEESRQRYLGLVLDGWSSLRVGNIRAAQWFSDDALLVIADAKLDKGNKPTRLDYHQIWNLNLAIKAAGGVARGRIDWERHRRADPRGR